MVRLFSSASCLRKGESEPSYEDLQFILLAGVDLWSAGCILAELLSGRPIMPGRTEVEQLHKIFKLCGSPSEEYWRRAKLPHATIFKPRQSYKWCIVEKFEEFPISSLLLIEQINK